MSNINKFFTLMAKSLLVTTSLFAGICCFQAQAFPTNYYTQNSQLATGKWVKVSVEQSGIYQLTAADLKKWGFNNIDAVRIYGYGALPQSEWITTDLVDDQPQVPVVRSGDKLLFYAHGISKLNATVSGTIEQQLNTYATQGYYFITEQTDVPAVAIEKASNTPTGEAVTTFTDVVYHEQDLINKGETGRIFLGEDFQTNSTQSFKFNLPGLVAGSKAKVITTFASKTGDGSGSKLTFRLNGNPIAEASTDFIPKTGDLVYTHYNYASIIKTITPSTSGQIDWSITYSPTGTVYLSRLDYVTVNYERKLQLQDGKLAFFIPNVSLRKAYTLTGATADVRIWDVTNPLPIEMMTANTGGNLAFTPTRAGDRNFIAFTTSANYPTPEYQGEINNQNLHAEATPDMVIISPKAYLSQAERVADMHRKHDAMRVLVVEESKIFNEFSSGTPDAVAYRKLLKMFYDRGTDPQGHKLGYLLLMGNGSFDNRGISAPYKAVAYPKLLTWQSQASNNENFSFTSDDFFATLADGVTPQFWNSPLNIAVGRFPVKSLNEATIMTDKLIRYCTVPDYGGWKNNVLNVADDEDNAIHMDQAENVIKTAEQNGGNHFLFNRVFEDAFTNESKGTGRYYPEANKKMYSTLREGVVWWNYTGHGSPNVWSGEHLLYTTDIQQNLFYNHLPILYGATCDFTRHDALATSGGEQVFLNPRGGAIAVVCPPRLVYISNNGKLNQEIAKEIFKRDAQGKPQRLGDIIKNGKNRQLEDNTSRYHIMGDPAMRPAFPTHNVVINQINGTDITGNNHAELQAQSRASISGYITDPQGKELSNFNGKIILKLFDAEQSVTTHGYGKTGTPYTFQEYNNLLGVQIDSVHNGRFTISLTIPGEISNNYRPALINVYAYSVTDSIEAQGSTNNLYVYGFSSDEKQDHQGPVIEVCALNSYDFRNGDNVNSTPLLLAKVSDQSGINFSSSGVGHAITLLIDEKESVSGLTPYFTPIETTQGNAGTISYRLSELSQGQHSLRLRIWDVYNNVSDTTILFNVVPGLQPELEDVYTDANPAYTGANFYIKHNRADANLSITLNIYDLLGRMVWTSTQTGSSNMFTSFPIHWDLTNQAGVRVSPGIYIYRATIADNEGKFTSKAKKIAVGAN